MYEAAELRRPLRDYDNEPTDNRSPGLGSSLQALGMSLDRLEKTAYHLIERLQPALRLDEPREARDANPTKSDGSDLRSQVDVLTRRLQDIADRLTNTADRVDL